MEERITGHTELIGLIAYPIRHSNSPKMHNLAFSKLGLDYAYLAFEVEQKDLKATIEGFRAMKIKGSNVSMPNKTAVIKYLDEVSKEAKLCNAVNTIVNEDGLFKGYNTDGSGFMLALKDNNINILGKKIVIVGAGGAATAITIQAAIDGVKEIVIFNLKDEFWENGKATVKKVKEQTDATATLYDLQDLNKLKEEMKNSALFVNATGVGMKPTEGVTYIPDTSYFNKEQVVVDIIYSPKETALLKLASYAGCKTMNGMGMMLFQGAMAFKLWTGKDMPIEFMKKALGISHE